MATAMTVHPAPEEACALPTLAVTDLRLRYHGKAAHAATAPHGGINAADALTVARLSMGLLRQHLEAKQMIHGIVTGGGAAPNIVPARTAATYYLRAADVESLRLLEGRVRGCFEAGAVATGCTHEVTQVSPTYAELAPDAWLATSPRCCPAPTRRSRSTPEER